MGIEYQAKRCRTCDEIHPVDNFNKDKTRSDGLMSVCRPCYNKKIRKKYDPFKKRSMRLKHTYGITREEYDLKLQEQDNGCAICKSDKPGGNGGFYVDHNHTTGQVRGLLCHWCNFMIGQCKENPEILRSGIEYLKKWSKS
jgi:hypothetical protein